MFASLCFLYTETKSYWVCTINYYFPKCKVSSSAISSASTTAWLGVAVAAVTLLVAYF
jgi:hypothetical protein